MEVSNPVSKLERTLVSVLVVAMLGAGLGFYLGMETQKGKDAATIADLRKTISDTKIATANQATGGQAVLTQDLSHAAEATTQSVSQRQDILTHSQPTPTTPGCPSGVMFIPAVTIKTINQLLEVSNETGYYDLSTSSLTPTHGLWSLPEEGNDPSSGASDRAESADGVLQATSEAGGPGLHPG